MKVKLARPLEEPLDVEVLQEVQINNKPFVVVDLGAGQHIKGVFSRYFVVSTACIMKTMEDIRVND
jgi:hypothetical protein